jgi:pimeloyl-ACP methyl ester carboxylesterase
LNPGVVSQIAQWDSIVPSVHKATGATLITYDRQGFGTSTIDTSNYSILNEIQGLEKGLRKLGYNTAPTILVSHSLGAFYARVYASRQQRIVKGILMLDPRIPSSGDMVFARNVNKSLDHSALKKESLGLYYVLTNMEKAIDFVGRTKLKTGLSVSVVMAEAGPFDTASDNERFKADERDFVKEGTNRQLIEAKGSTHNIPAGQPQFVIKEIISFYNKNMSLTD